LEAGSIEMLEPNWKRLDRLGGQSDRSALIVGDQRQQGIR